MTVRVEQRYKNDCFLCCITMLLGLSYDYTTALWGKEFVDDVGEKGLYGTTAIRNALSTFGMEMNEDYRSLLGPAAFTSEDGAKQFAVSPSSDKLRNLLWGRRAIVQASSLNYSPPTTHVCYWDGHELFDPSPLKQYVWDEMEIQHVWIFKERPNE